MSLAPDTLERRILRDAGRLLLVFGGYLLLSVFTTWPLVTRFASAVPGNNGDTQAMVVWPFWYSLHALTSSESEFHSRYVLAPWGADMIFHSNHLIAALLTGPIQKFLGVAAAVNVAILGTLALAGTCFYLLLRELDCATAAALVGGAAFASSPYVFAHLPGHFNLIQVQFLPFVSYTLIRVARRSVRSERGAAWRGFTSLPWPAILLLGITVWLTYVTDIYIAVIASLLGACFLIYEMVRLRVYGAPVFWISLFLAAVISLLCALPWVIAYVQATDQHDYRNLWPWAGSEFHVSPRQLLKPPPFHSFWGRRLYPSDLLKPYNYPERGIYLGGVAVIFGIAALALRGMRARAIFGWGLAAVFINLAAGNRYTPAGPVPNWMYLGKLWPNIPILDQVRVPSRFALGATFCMCLLLGLGVNAILQRLRYGRRGWAFAGFAVVLVMFDFAAVPVPLMAIEPSAWIRGISIPGENTVLTFPIGVTGGANGGVGYVDSQQMVDQALVHQRPLISAYLPRVSNDAMERLKSDKVLAAFAAAQRQQPFEPFTNDEAREFCRFYRVDAVLLDPGYAGMQKLVEVIESRFPVKTRTARAGGIVYELERTFE